MSCAGCEDCSLTQIASKTSPFEIHHTIVEFNDREEFRKICDNIGVKPLIITNVIADAIDADMRTDFMTRTIFKGSVYDAITEMERIAWLLMTDGLSVIRSKVETVPWLYENVKGMSKNYGVPYFETHIEIKTEKSLTEILRIAKRTGGHVSFNVDKMNIYMITYRSAHIGEHEFTKYADRMYETLVDYGLNVGRKIIELTLYDDNKGYDDYWTY